MFFLSSPAFAHEGDIPAQHTCDGKDLSPPLTWSGLPKGARSLALIVSDPDAPDPDAPKMTWIHWVLYNLPADCAGLAEGIGAERLPGGTRQGLNDWKRVGYGGPCPPIGRHRYYFRLYALETSLGHLGRPTSADLERAMRGHVLAEATLMGTYRRG
ncbi:MAG: YbhB/YbcL family Raf kinase inhibitor-like protein [Woeseiaceae bacterium]